MRRYGWMWWALVVLAVVGCGKGEPGPRRQAILIVIDAARADRFTPYGYQRNTTPNMAHLARRGVVFRNHYAQASATRPSLPLLFYSRYFARPLFPLTAMVSLEDPEDLFRKIDDEAISLPRALGDAGFATAMISAHTWIREDTPLAREFGEAYDLSRRLRSGGQPSAAQVVDHAIAWIDAHAGQDYFLYLHLMETHVPRRFGADARRFFGDGPIPEQGFTASGQPRDPNRELSAAERRLLDALYDGALRAADRAVGTLLRHLESRGLLDTTLVAITADHGENLMEVPGRLGHGGAWYEAVGRIPLILFYPPKLGGPRVVEALTESVDVHPTLLDLLDVPLPPGKTVDGTSLVPLARGAGKGDTVALHVRGIRDQRYKCMFGAAPADLLGDREPDLSSLSVRLFDLWNDPTEIHDVSEDHPDVVRRLLREYRRRMGPSYARYRRAVATTQPSSAFALPIAKADFDAPVAVVRRPLASSVCRNPAAGAWVRRRNWAESYVLGAPDAPLLGFRFAIPDGRYEISVTATGSGWIELQGGAVRKELRVPPGNQGRPRMATVSLGDVEVRNETLRGTLRPRPDGTCLMIHRLGFRPFGQPGAEVDARHEKRLRDLGYVEEGTDPAPVAGGGAVH